MQECINPEIGKLLLGYEFNGLTEEETEQFEIHVIECGYCHGQLNSFTSAIALLTSDEDVRQTVSSMAENTSISSESAFRRLWRKLWPETPLVFKPAIAYLLIIILLIPAYMSFKQTTTGEIKSLEAVNLLPDRSSGENVLHLDAGQDGLLVFVVQNAKPGKPYTVSIENNKGIVIHKDDSFNSFDRFGTGLLLLPGSLMEPGIYRLIIFDPQGEPPMNRQVWSFNIEK